MSRGGQQYINPKDFAKQNEMWMQVVQHSPQMQTIAMCIPRGQDVDAKTYANSATRIEVVQGKAVVYLSTDGYELSAGSVYDVPKRRKFAIANESPRGPLRLLVTFAPPAYPKNTVVEVNPMMAAYEQQRAPPAYRAEPAAAMRPTDRSGQAGYAQGHGQATRNTRADGMARVPQMNPRARAAPASRSQPAQSRQANGQYRSAPTTQMQQQAMQKRVGAAPMHREDFGRAAASSSAARGGGRSRQYEEEYEDDDEDDYY